MNIAINPSFEESVKAPAYESKFQICHFLVCERTHKGHGGKLLTSTFRLPEFFAVKDASNFRVCQCIWRQSHMTSTFLRHCLPMLSEYDYQWTIYMGWLKVSSGQSYVAVMRGSTVLIRVASFGICE